VNKNWGKLIETAKATLAKMLTGPCDEGLKETIYEALQLDATLIRGRERIGANSEIIGSKTNG
jgi:hypothetical protein